MKEIICPNCNKTFTIDESSYAAIVKQVHDKEFNKEIQKEIESAVEKTKLEMENEITELKSQIKLEKSKLENAVEKAVAEKESEIQKLQSEIKLEKADHKNKTQTLKETYENALKLKDETIETYKNFKAKQSTKMIGESLEQHCEIEFNKIRATAFPNAYFEKDNDAKSGSKGDYIFREETEDGIEIISIMFEMKNEADETATKHKNEDFFKELDKDRNQKKCEYAVLVSMLESDNELYNTGIVDVSYKYEKMYVIRPQFFISIISLLRNASLKSLDAKRELVIAKNQNIDISNFEKSLLDFKDDFAGNVRNAEKRFNTAIEEIDKTITHLQKTKDALLASERQLTIANGKVNDITIKKLTRNNPTMKEKFDDLHNQ